MRSALAIAAAASIGLLLAAACGPPAPDLVLLDAHVFTADPARPWAEALAIRGERIIAVGSNREVTALAASTTVQRDVEGHTIVPGFNDAHVADPQLDGPGIEALAQSAAASGITSMQWFAGGRPVGDTAAALLTSEAPQRVRVFRMPRPAPGGETLDSRPYLPPQPGPRLDVRGMGFVLAGDDVAAIRQSVSWAYGTEDLLALEPSDESGLMEYLRALDETGLPEVWVRKRPRLEQPGLDAVAQSSRLAALGVVAVARPAGSELAMASLVGAGVPLALATGRVGRPFEVIAWAVSPGRGGEALTMEQAITAFTRGSAHAEFTDREKGHLSVGALADLVVLSADPFSAAAEIYGIDSRLTIIAGRVVPDVR